MTTEQLLWGANTFLLACLVGLVGILYNTLRADLKEVKEAIERRTLITTCERVHEEIKKSLHGHASVGTAGEVVR